MLHSDIYIWGGAKKALVRPWSHLKKYSDDWSFGKWDRLQIFQHFIKCILYCNKENFKYLTHWYYILSVSNIWTFSLTLNVQHINVFSLLKIENYNYGIFCNITWILSNIAKIYSQHLKLHYYSIQINVVSHNHLRIPPDFVNWFFNCIAENMFATHRCSFFAILVLRNMYFWVLIPGHFKCFKVDICTNLQHPNFSRKLTIIF